MENEDDELGIDRDTSPPKNKMKIIPGTSKNIEEEKEKEVNKEEEVEEEEEEEDENDIKNNQNNQNKEEIHNDLNPPQDAAKDQNSEEAKIYINLNKNSVNSSCQINLLDDGHKDKEIQELKLKIKSLEKDKEDLLLENREMQKKYESKLSKQNKDINNLSIINNKLKKNLDSMNDKVTKLLNRAVENNSIPITNNMNKSPSYKLDNKQSSKNKKDNEEENKDFNEEIKSLKEQIRLKDAKLIFLTKQNKNLKQDYDSITTDGKNINQGFKLVEEIKKKNNEIRELEKEYKKIVSLKSENEELDYYKKKLTELISQIEENKNKINQLRQTIERYRQNELINRKTGNIPYEQISNNNNLQQMNNNNSNSPFNQSKIGKLKIKKENKKEYIINEFNSKKYPLSKNFSLLFDDLEKKAIFTLFPEEENFKKFNLKLDIIENNYNATSKRLQSNINELKQTIDDKEELISYLREKIRENEMKIKILLNQMHLERKKNDKKQSGTIK